MNSFHELQDALREYASGRGWIAPTNVKNLSIGLAAEAGKLLADIQWLDEDDLDNLSLAQRNALTGHLAKLTILLARLSDVLDIDSLESAHELHRTAPIQLGPDVRPVVSPPYDRATETPNSVENVQEHGEDKSPAPGDSLASEVESDGQDDRPRAGPDYRGQRLVNNNFSYQKLQDANFDGADLRQSVFRNSDLTGATFKGATLQMANFQGARLVNSDFTNADLRGANLSRADTSGATFDGARLDDAKLNANASAQRPEPRRANQDERKAKKPKKKSSQKRAHSPRPSAGRYRDLPTISSCPSCERPIDAVSGKCGCT